MPPSSSPLAELPEPDAAGALGDIYAAIRRTTEAPLVPLIYRHLATFPDALEWMWRVLGPLMESGELPARSVRVSQSVPVPDSALFPPGAFERTDLDPAALKRIRLQFVDT